MGTELSKAYVQIVPSAEGIGGKIRNLISPEASSAGDSAGSSMGGALVASFKKVLVGAGIGAAFKKALSEGGDLQQSFGGLDTIYGEAADAAKAYASEAAKAGISANNYAEQAVSFGAALKKAYSGDTMQAMEAANAAIIDMADNSAKMGTPIESIQAAYQSFARGQYQLLDNLKLGYGGTRGEMMRLLADAEKLTGQKYDIDNVGDVYAAIHAIQGELGLTGVAAEEASTTLTGSLGAMKAAANNLLANLALGQKIGPSLTALSETVRAFLLNNLVPMVGNVLGALPDLLGGLNGILLPLLREISLNAEQITSFGVELVSGLAQSIITAVPYLLEAAYDIASGLITALLSYDWLTFGSEFMATLRDNMDLAAAEILGQDGFIIKDILDGVTAALPNLLQAGVSIAQTLTTSIVSMLPSFMNTATEVITNFAIFLLQNAPAILQAGVSILTTLATGIAEALPQLALAAVEIVSTIGTYLIEHYEDIINLGIDLITQLVTGLVDAVSLIIEAMPEIISAIVDTMKNVDWIQLGKDIVTGIVNGIKAMASVLIDTIKQLAQSAFDSVKEFFQIGSPSRLMENEIGYWIPPGTANGIKKNERPLIQTMEELGTVTMKSYANGLDFDSINPGTVTAGNDVSTVVALLAKYLPQCAEKVVIDGESLLDGINLGLGMEGMAVI